MSTQSSCQRSTSRNLASAVVLCPCILKEDPDHWGEFASCKLFASAASVQSFANTRVLALRAAA